MRKIMVVDDDAAVAELLERELSSWGYEVVKKASSGEEAIEMAKRFIPDLILMDIVMPGKIDGIDAAGTIKAELNIPVIFLTGYADDDFIERAKSVSPFGYIVKPFQEKEIKAAIEVALYKEDLERELHKSDEHLKSEIEEHKRIAESLTKSEERYRILSESILECILIIDFEGNVLFVNDSGTRMFGLENPEEGIGKNALDFVAPEYRERVIDDLKKVYDGKGGFLAEYKVYDKNGKEIWVEGLGHKITYENQPADLIALRDISERKRMEEQSKVSLEEREVLLKEIHHRIKNNLQIVSSLLDMHSLRTYDPQTVDLLKEARAKIHAMALIHSQLYQSDRLAQVDMGNYIRELVEHLSQVYAIRKKSVSSDIEHSDVYLTISQAIPCALVLHELVSNALKYAFDEQQNGRIRISMQGSTEDKIFIRVEDDGIGIPEEIDIYKTDTMGLKLVRNLVQEQLKGSITVKRDHGTKFFIEFENLKDEVEHA